MTRTVRSRRAERDYLPLYARMLGLRHLAPSGLLCFVFFEGTVVLGILLALAELVSWWGVVVLPVTVGLMVKFNDMVAGSLTQRQAAGLQASARAAVAPGFFDQATIEAPAVGGPRVTFEGMTTPRHHDETPDWDAGGEPPPRRAWADEADARRQMARQAAVRRYE